MDDIVKTKGEGESRLEDEVIDGQGGQCYRQQSGAGAAKPRTQNDCREKERRAECVALKQKGHRQGNSDRYYGQSVS